MEAHKKFLHNEPLRKKGPETYSPLSKYLGVEPKKPPADRMSELIKRGVDNRKNRPPVAQEDETKYAIRLRTGEDNVHEKE